jgi:hypothetical protein
MLELALTLVLSSSPSPLDAWAQGACPAPARPPESTLEYKALEASRTECLKRAMNRALDKTLLPLRKERAPALREWMALQADYNRWMADACAAVEEARWVDLARGQRGMGTGYGATENGCLQRQYAWRGFFADAMARGDARALDEALAAFAAPGSLRGEELRTYQRLTQEAAARAPAQVLEPEAASPERLLSQEDWRHYNARLERAAGGPEVLARRQCALLSLPVAECEARLRDSLVEQLDFHEALPPAPVAPPVPPASGPAEELTESAPSEPSGAAGSP